MSGKKSVIVTGGGSGIGLAMSRHFASEGHSVAIFDVNQEAGARIASKLSSEFPDAEVTFRKCDVSSWEDQAAAFKDVYEKRGSIDIVMANAGISEQGSTTAIDLREEQPTEPKLGALKVNLVGVVYCMFSQVTRPSQSSPGLTLSPTAVKLASHYMNKKKDANSASRGLIVCTASNAGLYPFPVAPLYATSKFGVIGLVRSLALPLQRHGIQINGLAPAVLGKRGVRLPPQQKNHVRGSF